MEHLTNTVSSTIKPPLFSSVWDTNLGQPEAMFISDFGFWKELLMGSGWKVSMMSLFPVWLISLKVTLDVKGHCRMLSNSPFMIIPQPSTIMPYLVIGYLGYRVTYHSVHIYVQEYTLIYSWYITIKTIRFSNSRSILTHCDNTPPKKV